jgi:hypothetical protein
LITTGSSFAAIGILPEAGKPGTGGRQHCILRQGLRKSDIIPSALCSAGAKAVLLALQTQPDQAGMAEAHGANAHFRFDLKVGKGKKSSKRF